ncbi:MAG: hypothetical protein AAGF12_30505 [Myxococcota bacterium]
MEVHSNLMFVLKRTNYNFLSHEATDEIIVINLSTQAMIRHFMFQQSVCNNETNTIGIGKGSIFFLNGRKWKISQLDTNTGKEIQADIIPLHLHGKELELVSSSTDAIVMLEHDCQVTAVRMETSCVVWEFPISARGAFKCFNNLGIHLEGMKRRIWLINIETGNCHCSKKLYKKTVKI